MGRRGREFGSPGTWGGSHPAFNLWAQTGRALLELCFHGNTVYVIYIHVRTYASRLCKYFFKLFCISPELTCFWSVHADLKIKATDQYPLKQRFREMDYLLWKPLERINWHHWGLEYYYPVNQRRHRWDVPRNSCLVDFSFLTSAIGLMWCAGNNPICTFDESHFQKSFGHMFFGGSRVPLHFAKTMVCCICKEEFNLFFLFQPEMIWFWHIWVTTFFVTQFALCTGPSALWFKGTPPV